MFKKSYNFDDTLVKQAEAVLDEIGLDIDAVMKITLKRIIKDRSISFLLSDSAAPQPNTPAIESFGRESSRYTDEKPSMTKSKAINLFHNEGISFSNNITFASKNRSADNYWANPGYSVLSSKWFLILNDWRSCKIYLFVIPANSISPNQLVCRSDKRNMIDLQITYGDRTFTDMRSKVSFAKYLTVTLDY